MESTQLKTIYLLFTVLDLSKKDMRYLLEKVQEISGHKWLSTIEKYKSNDMVEQRRLINEFHPMNRM